MSKHKNNLSILYRHINDDIERKMSYYRMVMFFSDSGSVSETDILNIRGDSYSGDPLFFETKNELLEFAYNALLYFKVKNLYVLANTDYNIGIDSTQDSSGLKEMFERYGTEVKLSEEDGEGRGFLGKFF